MFHKRDCDEKTSIFIRFLFLFTEGQSDYHWKYDEEEYNFTGTETCIYQKTSANSLLMASLNRRVIDA